MTICHSSAQVSFCAAAKPARRLKQQQSEYCTLIGRRKPYYLSFSCAGLSLSGSRAGPAPRSTTGRRRKRSWMRYWGRESMTTGSDLPAAMGQVGLIKVTMTKTFWKPISKFWSRSSSSKF